MSFFSKFSSVADIVRKVVDMVYSFFKKRTDKCRELQRKIELTERELSKALRDGRVTDANRLALERRKLYEKYNGCPDSIPEDSDE